MKNKLRAAIREVPISQTYVDYVEDLVDKLISEGVIVPPVKVGQTVYRIYWGHIIDECRVVSLTQKSDKSWKIRIARGVNKGCFEIKPDKLGKTVFLTREEAERALERSEE